MSWQFSLPLKYATLYVQASFGSQGRHAPGRTEWDFFGLINPCYLTPVALWFPSPSRFLAAARRSLAQRGQGWPLAWTSNLTRATISAGVTPRESTGLFPNEA